MPEYQVLLQKAATILAANILHPLLARSGSAPDGG
jgi:hypothetical protein